MDKNSFKIDKKTGLPVIELEEKDMSDAFHISQMMETKGWQILMQYMIFAREAFIDDGKRTIRTRAQRDLSDIKWGVLKGFDEFISIPKRIVDRAETFKEDKKAEKEAQDGTNYNGE